LLRLAIAPIIDDAAIPRTVANSNDEHRRQFPEEPVHQPRHVRRDTKEEIPIEGGRAGVFEPLLIC
jgi:hypothetical protein